MGRQRLLRQRGSATIEFVLVIPLLVLVTVACLEVAALARTRMELVAAVREALGEPTSGAARVSVSRPQVVGRPATVEVVLRQRLRAPLLDRLSVTLTARASMRVER